MEQGHNNGDYTSRRAESKSKNVFQNVQFPPPPHSPKEHNAIIATPTSSFRRPNSTDRQRRMRISEKLQALHQLLPHSSNANQASVLDDVIDHIKYLQLQIKELSQSKLGGESSSEPFIFIEGYGHYMSHQQMQDEPLEEMMGKLLEVNPFAAAQLMEGKGLFLMPMDLVEGFYAEP